MATMITGLGGASGYGENSWKTNINAGGSDDDSTPINLTSIFGAGGINFFGTYYTTLNLGTNGIFTFVTPENGYAPTGVAGYGQPAIVPFWQDIDIVKGGDIFWDFDAANGRLIITFKDVAAYAGNTGLSNSFQTVLTNLGGGNFSIDFIYEKIEWTASTNVAANIATTGVTNGAAIDYELEGSGNDTLLRTYAANDFDVQQPVGIWSANVINGQIVLLDGVVEGTAGNNLIDSTYLGDPEVDRIDNNDAQGNNGTVANDDIVIALDGNDTVNAGFGNDQIYGGNGNDVLSGQAGADLIFGDGGNDSLFGGDGNDLLYGGAGNDSILGEAGDDRFFLGEGVAGNNDTIVGGETGETFGDLLDAGLMATDVVITFTGNEAGTVTTSLGNAVFSEIENATGGAGNDVINANNSTTSHVFIGGAGNDTIFGGAGAETLSGGTGADSLAAGAGNDSVSGGDGNDQLFGGAGSDVLQGDAGDDTFYFEDGFGNDTITGGETGQTNGDSLDAGAAIAGINFTFTGDKSGTVTTPGNATSFTEIENIIGGAGADTIDGSASTIGHQLSGGSGNDLITGGTAADSVYGGSGDDVINAGLGANVIDGGVGNDLIYGGAGNTVAGGENAGDADVLDLTAYGFAATNIIYDPMNGENGTVEFLDAGGAVTGTMTFTGIEKVIACFTSGTRIATMNGTLPIEQISAGTMVLTRDRGYARVLWAGSRALTAQELAQHPDFCPVRIAAGAMGANRPERDMMVSPQHRLLLNGPKAELLFGESEVLAAAVHLVGQPGFTREGPAAGVVYHHILFDEHEIVLGDGLWSESFQPNTANMNGLDNAQRAEIMGLFPYLPQTAQRYKSARLTLKRHEAKVLMRA